MMGFLQSGLDSLPGVAAMMQFKPPAASSIADSVDQLYLMLTGITIFFSVLIFSIIFYFMSRVPKLTRR